MRATISHLICEVSGDISDVDSSALSIVMLHINSNNLSDLNNKHLFFIHTSDLRLCWDQLNSSGVSQLWPEAGSQNWVWSLGLAFGDRLKRLPGMCSFHGGCMKKMHEPNSASTIRASAHIVSTNILVAKAGDIAKPSVGREVYSSHELGEGVRESEYLLTNNISTGPCISPYCPNMVELPNQMCGGMFADTVTSPSEETIPQLLSCLISKYLTPRITLRRCPVKFPLVDTNYQSSRLGSGEGNGTPLQYSCPENPMDGGAWWAAVHGVAEVRTQQTDFTFTFHFPALEKEMATHSSVLAGESQGWGSLVGCRLWGRTESDTTEMI